MDIRGESRPPCLQGEKVRAGPHPQKRNTGKIKGKKPTWGGDLERCPRKKAKDKE